MKLTNDRPTWLPKAIKVTKKRVTIVAIIVLTLYSLLDILLLGNIQYAIKQQQCGTRPVTIWLTNITLGGGEVSRYAIDTNPGWFDAKPDLPVFGAITYCTVGDAKAAYGDGFVEFTVH